MALITPTVQSIKGEGFLVTWGPITENDTCDVFDAQAADVADFADKTFSVTGTFGSTSVAIHGALINNFAHFIALRDSGLSVIAFTAAGARPIGPNMLYYMPVLTGGSSVSVYARMLCVGGE
jgi:hypothetical protein